MTQEKRLNRSRDALLGGVCAGVAEYFDVDPVVVRILVVVLTVASAGLLGVAYVAMWAVLPKAPEVVVPVEVEPQSVRSDTYGEVTAAVARGHAEGAGQQGASPAQAAAWRYASAAHVPPPP
ncbi:PspC domain-containing protein, partial [Rubneribacter badeniensis]|uniref:PspC domain-containing protein n=1 Tax=Rubneribacter badeniensis TaxID=2070688 RepID=UPI003A95A834